jgi:iron complex outermembrane receptor protein
MTCLGGAGNAANIRYDVSRDSLRGLVGRSYAAFGQASIKATDALGFTAGARISREEKDFSYYETLPLENSMVTFDHLRAKPGWNVFTPKLGAQYSFLPELMTYASFGLGFKAGGIPGRPASPALFKPTNPEWVTTYELGAKSEWFERRLRVNLAAFFSRYTDIQITRNTTDSQGAFVRLEQNAGNGRIFGFEAEASAAPIRGLTLSTGAGYTNFKFTSLLPQQAAPGMAVLSLHDQLPFTPKLTAVLGAAYRILLAQHGGITPRVDLEYSSGYFTDIGPNTPAIAQGRYLLLNARLAYAPDSEAWEVFVSGTNLTNRAVVGSGVYGPANGSSIVSYRPPRMGYAGVRFNFD